MFFSVITKNLNWELLTKNLVTFKRCDGVKDEKFEYYGGPLKNSIFKEGAGLTKNQYLKGNCLKTGVWTVYRFKWGEGGLDEKEELVFLRRGGGWYPSVHYGPSVCPFVSLEFSSVTLHHFFLMFYMVVNNCKTWLTAQFFKEILFFPKNGQNEPKMTKIKWF